MVKKDVLIIDDEIDFCVLMKHYLTQKHFDVYYCHDLNEGLNIIEMRRPAQIILGTNLAYNCEETLQSKVHAIENYSPKIFWTDANNRSETWEGSILGDVKNN